MNHFSYLTPPLAISPASPSGLSPRLLTVTHEGHMHAHGQVHSQTKPSLTPPLSRPLIRAGAEVPTPAPFSYPLPEVPPTLPPTSALCSDSPTKSPNSIKFASGLKTGPALTLLGLKSPFCFPASRPSPGVSCPRHPLLVSPSCVQPPPGPPLLRPFLPRPWPC